MTTSSGQVLQKLASRGSAQGHLNGTQNDRGRLKKAVAALPSFVLGGPPWPAVLILCRRGFRLADRFVVILAYIFRVPLTHTAFHLP